MVKCKYEGTGIWDGRCTGTKEVDPCPGYDKCKQYKPDYMSNADRIRAMSDEELAEFLQDAKFYCRRNCEKCLRGPACISMLQWLKQPAE